MSDLSEGIVSRYLEQNADARRAYADDPTSYHQINLLRRMLASADRAMEGDGVRLETRNRVLHAVVYGDADSLSMQGKDHARELLLSPLGRVRPGEEPAS